MAAWPTGIRPSGKGLRIRIWRSRKVVFSETIECDPYSQASITAATQRRKLVDSRITLGLPLEGETTNSGLFSDVAQDYLDTLEVKHSTSLSYENILNRYWMPHYELWPVTSITTQDIKRKLADLSVTSKTKKNIVGPLRGVLAHAEINPNPADLIKFRKRQREAVDRYSLKERSALMSKLEGQSKLYFAILFGCGLRPGECLALNWPDYDGEELSVSKQITKRRLESSTKTSVRRRVYVPVWVRQLLVAHPTRFEGGYIFQNSLGRFWKDTDTFNDDWRAAHKRARVPYRIPYTCRHTRASELLSTGVEPAEAAKQMGHSLEMFFRIYAEWIEEYGKQKDKSRFEGVELVSK